jgi:hypothetical protein
MCATCHIAYIWRGMAALTTIPSPESRIQLIGSDRHHATPQQIKLI